MKYRDLKLTFTIADYRFDVISICLEKLTTPIPRHVHSKNSYELHYVSFGYGTLIVDKQNSKQKFDIGPGTLFMTGPDVPHEQISIQKDPMTEYCIYMQVTNAVGNGVEQTANQQEKEIINTFLNCDFWFGTAENSIYEQFKQLFLELENRQSGYELMIKAILQQIILNVIRHYKKNSKKSEIQSSSLYISDLAYLIIEESFLYDYKNLTLEELAKRVSLGARQTERLLQKHYNKTFLQKKTEARMSAACQLLLESNKNIYEIAEILGYSSSEHFSCAFKKFYGVTPSKYKSV